MRQSKTVSTLSPFINLIMDNFIYVKTPVNIALIKYWGKLERSLNIPLNSSFSLTLQRNILYTETKICFDKIDSFTLYGSNGEILEEGFNSKF